MEQLDFTTLDWASAIFWTILGILFYKVYQYPRGAGFNLKRWVNENWLDAITGLLATPLVIKLGDIVFQSLNFIGIDLSGISDKLIELNMDPVKLSLVLSLLLQHVLYLRYKKNKNKNKDNK